MDADNDDRLDQLDELLRRFRPIEKLFHLVGAADPGRVYGLAQSCSEIGLNLTGQFREHLERVFRRDGGSADG